MPDPEQVFHCGVTSLIPPPTAGLWTEPHLGDGGTPKEILPND